MDLRISKSPTLIEHLKAVLQLPFMAIVVVPFCLSYLFQIEEPQMWNDLSPPITVIGIIIAVIGLGLFIKSIILFVKIGQGTLAPWNPTQNLVIVSLYRYTRNPMLLGVNLILLGMALLLHSTVILLWNISFVILNHFYFILREEPELLRKFGDEYATYVKHVPRWLPRLSPWKPESYE